MVEQIGDAKQKRIIIRIFSLKFDQRRELEELLGADRNALDTFGGLPDFIIFATEKGKWDEIEMYLERMKVR